MQNFHISSEQMATGHDARYLGMTRQNLLRLFHEGKIEPSRGSQGPQDPYPVDKTELDRYVAEKSKAASKGSGMSITRVENTSGRPESVLRNADRDFPSSITESRRH